MCLPQQAPELPSRNPGQRKQEVEDHGKGQYAKNSNRVLLVKINRFCGALTTPHNKSKTGGIKRRAGRGDHNRDPPLPTVSAGGLLLLKKLYHIGTAKWSQPVLGRIAVEMAQLKVQLNLIDIAPAPAFSRLKRPHDRMFDCVEMLRCMPVLRRIAATDVAALQAKA
jgi:hypothetical protein